MARERKINPCRTKGRYWGSRGTGRIYSFEDSKEATSPTGCECAGWMFCNAGSSAKPLVYGLAPASSGEPGGKFVQAEYSSELQRRGLIAISPCQGGFLNPDSVGTTAFKKSVGKTKFIGCFDVEKFLTDEGLIVYDPRESVGTSRDVADDAPGVDDLDDFLENARIRERKIAADIHERETFLESLRLSGEKIETSTDLIRSLAGAVEISDAEHDPLGGLLHDEGIRAREARIKRKVRFDSFMETLTTKQATAIKKIYLQNSTGRTQEEIAKSLKITHRALRDRLAGAVIKLSETFPELVGLENISRRRRLLGQKVESMAPFPIKFTDSSGKQSVVHISRESPHPFGAPRKRKDTDEAEIRTAIKIEFDAKLRFLMQSI